MATTIDQASKEAAEAIVHGSKGSHAIMIVLMVYVLRECVSVYIYIPLKKKKLDSYPPIPSPSFHYSFIFHFFFLGEEESMVLSVVLNPDGTRSEVHWRHEDVSNQLGGRITFVGAVPSLNVFIVARRDDDEVMSLGENPYCFDREVFMTPVVRGPLVFLATDDDGEPIDVDSRALATHWIDKWARNVK